MPANPNFTEIITTTLHRRSKDLADNVTTHHPLLNRLNAKGNIKMVSGGDFLVRELDFAENDTFLYYSGFQQLNVTAQDVLTAAQQNWKQAAVTYLMSGFEERVNAGPEKMIDLAQGRLTNAMRSFSNQLAIGIASDGSGSSGKQVTGLQAMIPDDPTTGTYGNIDAATFTNWQSQLVDFSVGVGAGSITPGADTIQSVMNALWLECIRGADAPDLIVAGNTYFQFYWNSLQAIQRITSPEKGESGFKTLAFDGPQGDASVIYDSTIDGERMYFMNTDFVFWSVHPGANMTPLTGRNPVDQDSVTIPIVWQGNLECSNRARQGVIIA